MNPILETILSSVLILVFVTFCLYGAYKIWRKAYDSLLAVGTGLSQAVENWPRASAKIIKSELQYDSFREKLVPQISWEYTFQQQKYSGNMLAPIQFTKSSKKELQTIVDFFKVGSVHQIYVNPKMHGVSYMFPKFESNNFLTSK